MPELFLRACFAGLVLTSLSVLLGLVIAGRISRVSDKYMSVEMYRALIAADKLADEDPEAMQAP